MTKYLLLLGVFISSFYFGSCSDPVNTPVPDQAPNTYLTLFPDSTIAPGSTSKRISWWGDSPQGFVVGYRISFDGINWGFTTKQDSTFFLSIAGSDSTFKFYVAAVDNLGLIDPTPASNLYPVVNTPPTIAFNYTYSVPDTVFPIVTLLWSANDVDGVATIKNIYYSINDTNNYRPLPGNLSQMTLTADSGLVLNGNNKVYIKAKDNAGAFSNTSVIPDSGKTFYVKKNTARVLFISDIPGSDLANAQAYYANAMDTVKYDVLDIKSYGGALTPKVINPMFIETLKLFKVVIWSGGTGNAGNVANFNLAQSSLPFYKLAGGKILFTSGFVTQAQAPNGLVNDFVPIDSVSSCAIGIVFAGTFNSTIPGYPPLTSTAAVTGVRNLYFSNPMVPLYSYFSTQGCAGDNRFFVKDAAVNPKVIYCSIPLYQLNGNAANTKTLFRNILFTEFGLN